MLTKKLLTNPKARKKLRFLQDYLELCIQSSTIYSLDKGRPFGHKIWSIILGWSWLGLSTSIKDTRNTQFIIIIFVKKAFLFQLM